MWWATMRGVWYPSTSLRDTNFDEVPPPRRQIVSALNPRALSFYSIKRFNQNIFLRQLRSNSRPNSAGGSFRTNLSLRIHCHLKIIEYQRYHLISIFHLSNQPNERTKQSTMPEGEDKKGVVGAVGGVVHGVVDGVKTVVQAGKDRHGRIVNSHQRYLS